MSDDFNRRRFLGKIGKTTAALGMTSAFTADNVAADETATVEEMLAQPTVQNAIDEFGDLVTRRTLDASGLFDILFDAPGADGGDGSRLSSEFINSHFSKTNVAVPNSRQRLSVEKLEAENGVFGRVTYDSFDISLLKVDPGVFGGATSLGSNSGPNSPEGGITIVGHKDGSYAMRSLTDSENELLSGAVQSSQFQAFTHSDTDSVLAISEDAVSESDRVKVYQFETDRSRPILQAVNSVDLSFEKSIWKGGVPPSDREGRSDLSTQDQDCAGEIGYCAVSGYLCILSMSLCGMCAGAACSFSAIAWPAVAVCLACVLIVCGPSWLPVVGSCGTALDCLLEYGSSYAPIDEIELPDWYADGDYPCY